MIKFTRLRFQNFLGFGNSFTEIDLNRSQLTTISGKNGAGKSSSMLDSITFVLFKKPFRNVNLAQLVNSINKKNCVVEIEFDIGPTEYKVVRGIQPVRFEIWENGELLNKPGIKRDYQDILEKQILKVDYKTFVQVVVLGAASYVPFMELKTPERRVVIENLLDLEIFSVMNLVLKGKIADNKSELEEIETNRKIIQNNIKAQSLHIANTKVNNDLLISEKNELILKTTEQVEKLTKEVSVLKDQLELFGVPDIKSINAKLQKLSTIKSQLETLIKNYKSEISFYEKNDSCPTCRQEINLDFKSSEIVAKTTAISEKTDGLAILMEKYNALSDEFNTQLNLEKAITQQKIAINSITSKITSANDYIISLQNDIKKLSSLNIGNAEILIEEYQNELALLNEKYDKTFAYRNTLGNGSLLLKDTGIKARIVKQFIPVLNKLINDYLSKMEFLCQFELDENFDETIKSRYRDIFSYHSFSQGEKLRINLAILFALREVAKLRNSVNCNLMIFDEVLDGSLDTDGVENFLQTIERLTDGTNTFIITHNTKSLDNGYASLQFEKVKGFSQINHNKGN
jgi:DNA repair exonuclease SbcCD ATPase subunit